MLSVIALVEGYKVDISSRSHVMTLDTDVTLEMSASMDRQTNKLNDIPRYLANAAWSCSISMVFQHRRIARDPIVLILV